MHRAEGLVHLALWQQLPKESPSGMGAPGREARKDSVSAGCVLKAASPVRLSKGRDTILGSVGPAKAGAWGRVGESQVPRARGFDSRRGRGGALLPSRCERDTKPCDGCSEAETKGPPGGGVRAGPPRPDGGGGGSPDPPTRSAGESCGAQRGLPGRKSAAPAQGGAGGGPP